MSANIDLNLTDSEFRRDPYPFYRRIREADPLHWNTPGVWLVTRYADAMSLLRDPRIGHPTGRTAEYMDYLLQQGHLMPIDFLLGHWLLSKNPPDHTRLRNLVSRAFTPNVVEALRPRIQQIVHDLLNEVQQKSAFDLMSDFAYPLPVMVIAEMLGVPLEDRDQFRRWSRDLMGIVDIVATADAVKQGNQAVQKFIDYFRDLAAQRRAAPQNDLLSALIAARDENESLSEHELLANCILLFIAGHETTMNLIGSGMLALLQNPDQLSLLRKDPSLISGAVEELLRYYSPVQFFGRTVREDMSLDGKPLRRGQNIFILPGAINRDPGQFPDPDRLDITRAENRHLAFGLGIHFCLGAPLARLEGQIAIATLVQRLPNLKLQSDMAVWNNTLTVRGLKSLPVLL